MGLLTTQIVVLAGPPASGKDTVTRMLTKFDHRFRLFQKLKCGAGRSDGYRMRGRLEFDELVASGKIAQSHERYGNLYAVDLPGIEEMVEAELVPVIHNGRMSDLRDLSAALTRWRVTPVVLELPRAEAERRIRARATGDTDARLAAYDEEVTEAAMLGHGDALVIDTSKTSADDAAKEILRVAGGQGIP